MQMKKEFVVFLGLLLICRAQAQITFERTYGMAEYSEIGAMGQQTNDGGYILGVNRDSITWTAYQEIYLVKTDTVGSVQWVKIFENSYLDEIVQTSEGGYLFTGYYKGYFSLVKLDSAGNEEWNKRKDDTSGYLKIAGAGEYVFVGDRSTDTISTVVQLVKVNANGDTLGTRTLSIGIPNAGVSSIELTADGGYVIGGPKRDVISGDSMYHGYLSKFDSSGTAQWTKTYGEDSMVAIVASRQTTDGGYVLCGLTDTTLHTGYLTTLAFIIRTDSIGDTLWTVRVPFISAAQSVWQTSDGNFVLGGSMMTFGTNSQFLLCKVDDAGNTLWLKTYGDIIDADDCNTMQPTFDGGFMLLGSTYTPDPGEYHDVFLVKTDAEGYTSIHSGIATQGVVTGKSFPNPFSNSTTIIIPNTEANTTSRLTLAVLDMSGKSKEVVTSVFNTPKETHFIVQRDNLPAGVYLYQVMSDKAVVVTGKLVIF